MAAFTPRPNIVPFRHSRNFFRPHRAFASFPRFRESIINRLTGSERAIPILQNGHANWINQRRRGALNVRCVMSEVGKMMLRAGMAAVVLGMATVSAHATTYLGTRTVGSATVNISITTDGSLGWIPFVPGSPGNSYTLTMTAPGVSRTFGVNHGAFRNSNINFFATATQLSFDFSSAGFFYFDSGGPEFYYGFVGNISPFGGPSNSEQVRIYDPAFGPPEFSVARSGLLVIASTAALGAVPEPASWALMLGGFGLTGGALRGSRRRGFVKPVLA
jgi:hypothetical protein